MMNLYYKSTRNSDLKVTSSEERGGNGWKELGYSNGVNKKAHMTLSMKNV